jgi:hypothetical protein
MPAWRKLAEDQQAIVYIKYKHDEMERYFVAGTGMKLLSRAFVANLVFMRIY